MSETKAFPTLDVLGATSGFLLAEMGGIYQVLNFMTNSDLFTHQIPRAIGPAAFALIKHNPAMVPILQEIKNANVEQRLAGRDGWLTKLGATIEVPRIAEGDYEVMDPIAEFIAMRGGADTAIVVV
ncbi:hypothetical protein HOU00_gp235 [Caulobacter phage CcrPW]|uniref:DUF7736 domain-containing protein n=1 Tax=Caulobacter phage CcrPW TaxID=2283271 RepID=A0A385EB65_9CAUD|nr:hypothetical protein HOU00_gp235 [Caulobacter phage CcrPW]AXQ68890.1 hypothetical protein CcrPW_gp351 [Caulobacter phage CcrPW]